MVVKKNGESAPEDAVCLRTLFFPMLENIGPLPVPPMCWCVCVCERKVRPKCKCVNVCCIVVLETVAPEDAVRQRTRFPTLESIGPHPAAPEDAVRQRTRFPMLESIGPHPEPRMKCSSFPLFFFGGEGEGNKCWEICLTRCVWADELKGDRPVGGVFHVPLVQLWC